MEEQGKRARARTMDVRDRLSGLPDELLHRVLSFLPARDAVRTCVLAPRWRHLWPSARRLDVDSMGFATTAGLTRFMTNLLIRRGHGPLDAFRLRANIRGTANLWIYYAVRCCNVQSLDIVDDCENDDFYYPDRYSFTSSHLKSLHLCLVGVNDHFIKHLFSSCPSLEDLEMIDCCITAKEYSSTTLKSLSIISIEYSGVTEEYLDIVIDMPSLVSLYIGELYGTKLSSVNLQSLLTASISIEQPSFKFSVGCYILRALSNVRNLEFQSTYPMEGGEFLGNDMLFCQVEFTNLTTLSLGDWCLYHSCQALLYVLKWSPNLERLTLMLSTHGAFTYHNPGLVPNRTPKIDPPCKGAVTPFNCTKLQKIEIICPKHDNRVGAVVMILCANLIPLPEINIKPS